MSGAFKFDRRIHAAREDLADAALKDSVKAARFVAPDPATVTSHFIDIHAQPSTAAGLDVQALFGESLSVFERSNGWAWIRREADGYIGYAKEAGISARNALPPAATHKVTAPRTFLYSKPDLKSPRSGYRSIGSHITVKDTVEVRGTRYAILSDDTAIIANHICPLDHNFTDYVAVAETLLHTPYLWGGNTGFGVDCSGIVQLSMGLCGVQTLRDSDQLEATIGTALPIGDFKNLQPGDLVFWKGHVGIMKDGESLLHANGHSMNVCLEPLANAIERIGYLYGQPTSIRRP